MKAQTVIPTAVNATESPHENMRGSGMPSKVTEKAMKEIRKRRGKKKHGRR
jgi:hypothetical protein